MSSSVKSNKSELTRAKLIEATIECIYADGFHAAHTNRIIETAGVSWGVIQYQFGDKDGLLQAVLESIFAEFIAVLKAAKIESSDLQERLRQLADTVWELVSRKDYRVSIAILRNAGQDQNSSIDGQKQLTQWAKETSILWDRLFLQDACDKQHSEIAKHLFFATLRGLADEINPKKNRSKKTIDLELAALSQATHFLLSQSTP